jgi:hypothetical protein
MSNCTIQGNMGGLGIGGFSFMEGSVLIADRLIVRDNFGA